MKLSKFINHPLFSGSVIMIVGSNATSFINYIYHFVMGRLLGPSNYGELAALFSLIGILGILPSSINLAIIKYVSSASTMEEAAGIINWLNKKVLLFTLVFSFILFIATPFLASFLKINDYFSVAIISVVFFFGLPAFLNRSALQGLLRFRQMVVSILVENSVKLILGVILVYLGFSVSGAMGALIVAGFIGWWLSRSAVMDYLNIRSQNKPRLKSFFSYAIPIMVQSVAMTSLYSADLILVKHFFPSHEAGIYAAISILGKIIFFGAGPISAVMFPIVAQRKTRGENHQKIFKYSFLLTLVLSSVILTLYWLMPEIAIKLLPGSLYLEGADLLVWFGIFMTFYTLASLFINYHLSMGRTTSIILPVIAAVAQIVSIWLYHSSLIMVMFISITVTALLLISLLIYSIYGNRFFKEDKTIISNSSGL